MLDRVNAAVGNRPCPAHSNGTMRSQDLTITILGSHMRRAGGRVWSGGMVKLIGEFGFSTEAVRAALSRLVTRGMLERHRDGRMINYALTPRAQELLAEGDRRIFSFGRRAPGGRRLDPPLAHDPGGPPGRALAPRLAPALPRLRLAPGRHLDRGLRPRGGGARPGRQLGRRRLRLDLPRPHGARLRAGDPLLRRLGPPRPRPPLRRVPRDLLAPHQGPRPAASSPTARPSSPAPA